MRINEYVNKRYNAVSKQKTKTQKGSALLYALLITALVATFSAGMLVRQAGLINQTNIVTHYEQAIQYAYSLELWAKGSLIEQRLLAEDNKNYIALGQRWAQKLDPTETEHGEVSGEVIDQQALFNINNLLSENPKQLNIFRRLLQQLDLDTDLADEIYYGLLNRKTQANETQRFAASNYTLPGKEKPEYLTHISELMLNEAMNYTDYLLLAPYITALPVERGSTKININTAPLPILMALDETITRDIAQQFINQRQIQDNAGFPTWDAANKDSVLKDKLEANLTDVNSSYFMLISEVEQQEQTYIWQSLLHLGDKINDNTVRIALKWRNRLYPIVVGD